MQRVVGFLNVAKRIWFGTLFFVPETQVFIKSLYPPELQCREPQASNKKFKDSK